MGIDIFESSLDRAQIGKLQKLSEKAELC